MTILKKGKSWKGLRLLVEDKGTFYVFYDRMQLVQGRKVPAFIEDSDCRLTLYKKLPQHRKYCQNIAPANQWKKSNPL